MNVKKLLAVGMCLAMMAGLSGNAFGAAAVEADPVLRWGGVCGGTANSVGYLPQFNCGTTGQNTACVLNDWEERLGYNVIDAARNLNCPLPKTSHPLVIDLCACNNQADFSKWFTAGRLLGLQFDLLVIGANETDVTKATSPNGAVFWSNDLVAMQTYPLNTAATQYCAATAALANVSYYNLTGAENFVAGDTAAVTGYNDYSITLSQGEVPDSKDVAGTANINDLSDDLHLDAPVQATGFTVNYEYFVGTTGTAITNYVASCTANSTTNPTNKAMRLRIKYAYVLESIPYKYWRIDIPAFMVDPNLAAQLAGKKVIVKVTVLDACEETGCDRSTEVCYQYFTLGTCCGAATVANLDCEYVPYVTFDLADWRCGVAVSKLDNTMTGTDQLTVTLVDKSGNIFTSVQNMGGTTMAFDLDASLDAWTWTAKAGQTATAPAGNIGMLKVTAPFGIKAYEYIYNTADGFAGSVTSLDCITNN